MSRADELGMFLESGRNGLGPMRISLDELYHFFLLFLPPPLVEFLRRLESERIPVVRLAGTVRSLLDSAVLNMLDVQSGRRGSVEDDSLLSLAGMLLVVY